MTEKNDLNVEYCLGKESQEASNYEEMLKHAGHKLQIISFPRGVQIMKVSMECLTCNKVLIEYDNPDYGE